MKIYLYIYIWMDGWNGPSIGRIPPPCASAGQHKSTKTDRYGFVWASTTGQPSHSHWCLGSAIRGWRGRQVPSMFQWVAVGECIPLIPRAARTQLVSRNSCPDLRRHPGKPLPCLPPFPPLLHIINVVFMTFFGLVVDYRAPSIPALGLLLKC